MNTMVTRVFSFFYGRCIMEALKSYVLSKVKAKLPQILTDEKSSFINS
jgi:hypothetical protein